MKQAGEFELLVTNQNQSTPIEQPPRRSQVRWGGFILRFIQVTTPTIHSSVLNHLIRSGLTDCSIPRHSSRIASCMS